MNPFQSLLVLMALFLTLLPFGTVTTAQSAVPDQSKIESYILDNMEKSEIPGMAVVLIQDGRIVMKKGYGYADLDQAKPVTPSTLFELGSTSKAFTGLAVLQLEREGKLKLSDPVTQYIPWLSMTYEGKEQVITLADFLHHTSGVGYQSIDRLPEGDSPDSLEMTVRTLTGQELKHQSGKKYEYATINYDVLGLVIEEVTQQSYESYVKEKIMGPLGLDHTYLFAVEEAAKAEMATGYRKNFTEPHTYHAPSFRGNTPAGYVISNADDIARWMQIQMGVVTDIQLDPELIERSHQPNRRVQPSWDGSSYAAGWQIYQKDSGEISHGGINPGFSSYFVIRPEEKLAVAVLANINSDYTPVIAQGIMNQITGEKLPVITSDTVSKVDTIATILLCVIVPASLLFLIATVRGIGQTFTGKRQAAPIRARTILSAVVSLAFLVSFLIGIYLIPYIMFDKVSWNFIRVWASPTLLYAGFALAGLGITFYIHQVFTTFFPKQGDKQFLTLVFFSFVSGFGNAFIIFTINQTFGRTDNLTNGLLYYFALGIVMYIIAQKIIRTKLTKLTTQMVYDKRMEIVKKLMNTSYQNMETIDNEKVYASLNNDTEQISDSINLAITGITHLITLLCCFIYLGMMNLYGLLLSVVVIVLAAGLHSFTANRAGRVWEITRDMQNVFFKYIHDLLYGFKELTLHLGKRRHFQADMDQSCVRYRDTRNEGMLAFVNVFVLGELIFVFVIGFVAFGFLEIFPNMSKEMISTYVFVFLYMTGPVNGVLQFLPQIIQMKISWKRINELLAHLESIENSTPVAMPDTSAQDRFELSLQDVEFGYKNKEGQHFSVGPINYQLRSGEILFITGGNGSGKSTLAKLLTGLYAPDSGRITLNGRAVTAEELGQYYSAIFGDFYLFDRLYGIEVENREQEIQAYLDTLQLTDKVQITNGSFTTTKLSTGQKKRLALLVTYLENRPLCLFDEWAADQDPEYRRFFYEYLLPEMKQNGKCIIAITHDDAYFHLADKLIKLDMGQIVNTETSQRISRPDQEVYA
ncbi:cyclic peptide export ABC transporter [Brevibacillus dissolubilis]|uniref:cyclic peptide export ABC transporter n=1 Tax=Brevibacillus dissolubilis TaxID=1844116 RepID=UPI001116F055|nr:cyclic peptide export ABC transporter [Brevibacillus dissolubilis]